MYSVLKSNLTFFFKSTNNFHRVSSHLWETKIYLHTNRWCTHGIYSTTYIVPNYYRVTLENKISNKETNPSFISSESYLISNRNSPSLEKNLSR